MLVDLFFPLGLERIPDTGLVDPFLTLIYLPRSSPCKQELCSHLRHSAGVSRATVAAGVMAGREAVQRKGHSVFLYIMKYYMHKSMCSEHTQH